MNTELLQFIGSYIITPSVIASVFAFIFYKVFNLGEYHQKFSSALENIKKLQEDINGLETSAVKITQELGVVKALLISDLGIDAGVFHSKSPLSLQPLGEKVLKESAFERIFENNKEMFLDKIREYGFETESDIDTASADILELMKEHELFKDFKEVAYQNGITLEVLLRACAIYMRDQAIKELLT